MDIILNVLIGIGLAATCGINDHHLQNICPNQR
jgi:hypothetical protein